MDRLDHCFELLGRLADSDFPAPVDQLNHSLQTATFAWNERVPRQLVLAALLHDIGRLIDSDDHGLAAAELIRPLVGAETYWIVRTHEIFMWRHARPEFGLDPDGREVFRDELWFAAAEKFVDQWDCHAFSRDAQALPFAFFQPLLRDHCLVAPESLM
jgi:predicted HD phosphohydrolase